MGISDDIKPKKAYRYVEKQAEVKVSVDNLRDAEATENITQPVIKRDNQESYERKTTLEDDFFNAKEHEKKSKKKNKKTPGSGIVGKLLWPIVFLIVVFAVYKNSDLIKEYISKDISSLITEDDEPIYTNSTSEQPSDTSEPNQNKSETVPEVAETQSVPSVDTPAIKSSIALEVLNGNGIRGSADKVSDLLVASGFIVSKVANAKKFTYTNTIIYYKTGKESAASLVESALENNYSCEKTLSDALTSGYDVVVVVGKS